MEIDLGLKVGGIASGDIRYSRNGLGFRIRRCRTKFGPGQTSNFTCAESNANEAEQ